MSSIEGSSDMDLNSHYSLRWNNHQAHIIKSFEALLLEEHLVDVTLVCADASMKAHKVVLSACSPFFQRIFADHPCKHPVVVVNDFPGREISALIDFMYRGEVSVGREDLSSLMKAAESLQIRGLSIPYLRLTSPPGTPTTDLMMGDLSTPDGASQIVAPEEEDNMSEHAAPPISREIDLQRQRDQRMKNINFSQRYQRESSSSPSIPRRKQARPRRRSGDSVAQDLSKPHTSLSSSPENISLNLSNNNNNQHQRETPTHQQHHQHLKPHIHQLALQHPMQQRSPVNNLSQHEDMAENLSMKRDAKHSPSPSAETAYKSDSDAVSSPSCSPAANSNTHPDGSLQDLSTAGLSGITGLTLTPPHQHSDYLQNLGHLVGTAPVSQWMTQQSPLDPGHHPREGSPFSKHYPYQQADDRNLARPQVGDYQLDGLPALGGGPSLYPHGPPLELHDSFKAQSIHGFFIGQNVGAPSKKSKKHRGDGLPHRRWNDHRGLAVCRPKGQHSAPRGGPPRSWTNHDLTQALTMVWNKQMTTSQASRVYSIPYNSLLMYVRGKYGKSLKLEQLRRDCTGEVMNCNNNIVKAGELPQSRLPLPHPAEEGNFTHPLLGANLPQGFFPEFNPSFPVPVSMVHLLQPSDQKSFHSPSNTGGCGASDLTSKSRTPSPNLQQNHDVMPPPTHSAPALLQQNGSN